MKLKRLLSLVVCVAMLTTALFSISAVSAAEVANGTCGSNLTWTLDDAGTLTISGIGLMYDYSNKNETDDAGNITKDYSAPWINYAADIKKVVIGKEVSYIGENAFEACTALESVVLSAGTYAPYVPVESFALDTPYKLMSYNANAPIYANTVSGGLKATPNAQVARDFYLEEATTLEGAPAYRIYYYYNDVKNYLYHSGTSTTGFKYTETVPLYNETTDDTTGEVVQGDEISTVWTYEESTGAWLAPASNNRFLAADTSSTREDIRCYAYSNITKAQYSIAKFAVKDPAAAADIPGITSIGKYAFSDCAALTNIYCRTTEEAWAKVSVQSNNDVIASANVTFGYTEDAPATLELNAGSIYTIDEENAFIILKAAKNTGESQEVFMSNIATDRAYVQVINASGDVQTGVQRISSKYSVQLLGNDGGVVKTYKIILLGDCDGNGRFSSADVSIIENYVITPPAKGTADFATANTDGNSRLSSADVSVIEEFVESGTWN